MRPLTAGALPPQAGGRPPGPAPRAYRRATDNPPDPARGGEADERPPLCGDARPPQRHRDGGDERTVSPLASAQSLEERCIDTIRFLAVDGVQKANSGHPGMPMGAAPVAHVLWTRHLRFDPADPAWPDRDRFVLSAGHGSHAALLPAAPDRLRPHARRSASAFRQWGSRTPGTPSTATPPASRRRPARWARASPTPSAWPSPSASSRRAFNGADPTSSTTTPTCSSATAT